MYKFIVSKLFGEIFKKERGKIESIVFCFLDYLIIDYRLDRYGTGGDGSVWEMGQ
jgi:hypothetical protein